MSETSFPINDLLRRRLQTGLVVACLALCVASTNFLLLSAARIGFGISLVVEGKLTTGFSSMFSSFIVFLGVLVFLVGMVMASFMVHVMMSQRAKDIGLMKAVGCPNDILFGYFFTELLVVAFISCLLGVVLGVIADFVSTTLFGSFGLQIQYEMPSLWLLLITFMLFFALTLVFGARPVLKVAKSEPAKAVSPVNYLGLEKTPGFSVVSKSGVTMRIALRSLYRHRTATIRLVVCLSTIFLLVTVAVAGGIIADSTTKNWVERAIGRDVALIGHRNMTNQYRLLLSEFYDGHRTLPFDYMDQKYLISTDLVSQLRAVLGNASLDTRLVLKANVSEVAGVTLGESTGDTKVVGDSRKGASMIIGVDPQCVLSKWYLRGDFLSGDQVFEAVVGDTLAQKMLSVPLVQGMKLFNTSFRISGVCLDPIDNGNVTYVPIKTLQNITGLSKPNIIIIKKDSSDNLGEILAQLRTIVSAADPEFEVSELNEILDRSVSLLGYIWSMVMFLPLFSLGAASLCLLSYVMLTINEQRQELGVLRALGAAPRAIVTVISDQSLVVLLSSYALGVSFGIITTLLILVQDPLVTSYTVFTVAGWLLIALTVTFLSALYPALRLSGKPILEIMNQA